ncbi:MAG: hypothetical protein Kow0029_08990 [Candidatus Rifleibacteriota bacterium]
MLPVLVYHHIQKNVTSDVSCTPEDFKQQMKAILAAGYTPLNLSQTRRFLAGALEETIEKPVLITFDDGYESLYYYALSVSRELKIPMTVFVITSRIGRRMQFSQYLSEHQIMEMGASGFWEFGSHSHDLHTDIIRIFNAFGSVKKNPVISLMRRDLVMSATRLESLLNKKITALAWPYGKFNCATTAVARNAGYKLHFTSCYGLNEAGANPFAIKRIPVSSRDTPLSVIKKISKIE